MLWIWQSEWLSIWNINPHNKSKEQTTEAHARVLNYEIEQRRKWVDWVLKLAFMHLPAGQSAHDIYNPSHTATTVTGTSTPRPSLDKHSSVLKVRSLPVAAQMQWNCPEWGRITWSQSGPSATFMYESHAFHLQQSIRLSSAINMKMSSKYIISRE